MKHLQDRGTGQAHAKAILLGEHSVVYGRPAIAFPVHALTLTATATLDGEGWRVESPLHEATIDPHDDTTEQLERLLSATALRNTLAFLGECPDGISVSVSGHIPPARGLGSSAAVAAAIARAVADIYERDLTGQELFDLVQSVERVAHGTPSGLDAYATTGMGPVWFEHGTATALRARTMPRLLVADTGVVGNTAEAVARVRAMHTSDHDRVEALLDEAAELALGAGKDLEGGDFASLGQRMNRNHAILQELGVSDTSLETLVGVALDSGALGAKLTGGGMGGCMIALVDNEQTEALVAEHLSAAGATDVWRVHHREETTL